jgi:hypothetical protein
MYGTHRRFGGPIITVEAFYTLSGEEKEIPCSTSVKGKVGSLLCVKKVLND